MLLWSVLFDMVHVVLVVVGVLNGLVFSRILHHLFLLHLHLVVLLLLFVLAVVLGAVHHHLFMLQFLLRGGGHLVSILLKQ